MPGGNKNARGKWYDLGRIEKKTFQKMGLRSIWIQLESIRYSKRMSA